MSPRRAYTLIELVLAMASTSILLLGVSSAIIVASRAAYDPTQPQAALARSRSVAQQIADELAQATSVPTRTATAVEFTVADRDSDGSPDTIRYDWSGTIGDGIYRSFNGESALFAPGIASLAITYDTVTESANVKGVSTQGPEQLLYSFEDATQSSIAITTTSWLAQTIAPVLPSDATAWSITRVSFQAKQDGAATGTLIIKLRSSLAVLTSLLGGAGTTVNESALPLNYDWVTIPVSNITGLGPTDSVSISIETTSLLSSSGKVQYCDGCEGHPIAARWYSSNAGASWSLYVDGALNLKVYGTITRPARDPSTLTRLVSARVAVTSYKASLAGGEATANLVARPVLSTVKVGP